MRYYKYLLIIVGVSLCLWGVNYPFVGGYNANNNYLMLAAKNYLRFGFLQLRFFPTYFTGAHLPVPVPYYLHHPIFIFLFTTIPFVFFGFHNWVVHVANFLLLVGDIFLIYKIGELVWNKQVGLWAAGLAFIFPMTTFFWKYMMFEQGSMFCNLFLFYFLYAYLKNKRDQYILFIFLSALCSGLMDWGVLYLFIPLIVLAIGTKKNLGKPLVAYLSAAVISVGFFMLSVYLFRGGFTELSSAISVHAFTPALYGLSFWPGRLLGITLLRFVVYFTPFSLLWFGGIRKSKTLLFFFLFGCMNIIVLPTVTWEDSYFLFYFTPFLAFGGALWITRLEKNKRSILFILIAIILWSITVNYLKIQQLENSFGNMMRP